jgi:hypothetical protein
MTMAKAGSPLASRLIRATWTVSSMPVIGACSGSPPDAHDFHDGVQHEQLIARFPPCKLVLGGYAAYLETSRDSHAAIQDVDTVAQSQRRCSP